MAESYEKPYVRPVIMACYGKKGCSVPQDGENSAGQAETTLDAKGEEQQ